MRDDLVVERRWIGTPALVLCISVSLKYFTSLRHYFFWPNIFQADEVKDFHLNLWSNLKNWSGLQFGKEVRIQVFQDPESGSLIYLDAVGQLQFWSRFTLVSYKILVRCTELMPSEYTMAPMVFVQDEQGQHISNFLSARFKWLQIILVYICMLCGGPVFFLCYSSMAILRYSVPGKNYISHKISGTYERAYGDKVIYP